MSACSESQSTIFPLPSSPHWEPTTTTFAMRILYAAASADGFPAAISIVAAESSTHGAYQRHQASERQCAHALHVRELPDLLHDIGRHRTIDLDQRDRVAAGRLASEMEGGDVDAGIAENSGEMPDEARLVDIGDVEHGRPKLGVHLDALDGHHARPPVGKHRALDRTFLPFGDDRGGDQAFIIAFRVAFGLLDRDAA